MNINERMMKKYRRLITTGELRDRRNERRKTGVAILILLIILIGLPVLAVLIFSPDTNLIFNTALSGISHRTLIVISILILAILFTGICFLILRTDIKKAGLKDYLKVLPFTVIAGVVCHAVAINFLLNINQWLADGQAYKKEYKVVEVRTQCSHNTGYTRYNMRFLFPHLKEVKVEYKNTPGKFLYFYVNTDFAVQTGNTLNATLRDGIWGWKVVENAWVH